MTRKTCHILLIGAGYLLSSLLLYACSQEEVLSDTQIILLEKPIIDAYAKAQGLEGSYTLQGVFVVKETEGDTATSFATSSSLVDLTYEGSLLTGEVFSRTGTLGLRTAGGEWPILRDLIPGLESGITLFRKGGKGILIVPSPLAYEEYGSTDGKIPPDAILRFDFTLLDIE